MNIITGYRGEAHITADQIRDQNQGCFGDGSYILDVGSKLEATAVSATSVQLADGIISHQGCTASIPYGSTEAVTIGNGTQGMQRIDLIVARYTKDAGTGVEDMSLAVIQGTPAASNPSTPSCNEGSIHAGDSPVDMPLFEVALDGISIDSVTQVASVVKTQAETDAEISALNSSLAVVSSGYITPTSTRVNAETSALIFYRIGKFGLLYYNIGWSSQVSNTETVVCSISAYGTPTTKFNYTTCNQNGDPYLIQVYANGNISFYANNHASQTMVRGMLAFPLI